MAAVNQMDRGEVLRLDYDNYDKLTESRTVFIFFFAPWCGHCKRLSQDWARLAKQWHKSDVGLIAEVDCTDNDKGGGKILCNYFGIESFPTLKYGDPNDLNLYDGKRSLQELSNFAEEQLVPICSPSKFGSKFCDDDSLSTINKYLDLSVEELREYIETEEEKLEEAETIFDDQVRMLTERFEAAEEEKRLAIKTVSDGDLNLMKQIIWMKEANQNDESDDNNEIFDEL